MKRSEMLDMLTDEIEEILEMSKFKSVNDAKFCERRARGLLDLIEGLGMLPPDQNANATPPCEVLTYWEPED